MNILSASSKYATKKLSHANKYTVSMLMLGTNRFKKRTSDKEKYTQIATMIEITRLMLSRKKS